MVDAAKIGLDDLPDAWRVDVRRAWVGLEMKPSFAAQLAVRGAGSRYRKLGVQVVNDEGPVAAISDLLSALDCGMLPR